MFWLFLALGWGFALITALMSWWRVDHGLAEVRIARTDRDRYAKQVDELKEARAAITGEWPAIYLGLRKAAFDNAAVARALMVFYQRVVLRHSRYHDIEMACPEIPIPPELQSPEPPPLLTNVDKEEREKEKETLK
jgi:hypothetical protein